jgi:2-methylcitrate dehydratase PrpD
MDLVDHLVRNLVSTRYEDLSPNAVLSTKKIVLDTLGCILAGRKAPGVAHTLHYIKKLGGRRESTIIGERGKFPASNATMANSSMARALDLDEAFEEGVIHSAVSVVPASLAVSEKKRVVAGKEFIMGVAMGIDLACRLSLAPKFDMTKTGISKSLHFGTFGAAAAAGKILEFGEEKMLNAMDFACNQASGLTQCVTEGTFTLRVQQGLSARAGVVSAELAEEGLTGAKGVLQGVHGYFPVYYRNETNLNKVTERLGEKFLVEDCSLKPYPSCRYSHAPIEAALRLLRTFNVDYKNIQKVSCKVGEKTYRTLCEPFERKQRPKTIVDAQFSLPYTVACALVKRDVIITDFSEEAIQNRIVLGMARKVKPILDTRMENGKRGSIGPVVLEIKTKDNKVYSQKIDFAKGHPKKPMGMDEVVNKFGECVASSELHLSEKNIQNVVDIIINLEDIGDISLIAKNFSPGKVR